MKNSGEENAASTSLLEEMDARNPGREMLVYGGKKKVDVLLCKLWGCDDTQLPILRYISAVINFIGTASD